MAKFEIKTSFKLSARNILVLAGEIIEGTISVGDHIWFSDGKQAIHPMLGRFTPEQWAIGQ